MLIRPAAATALLMLLSGAGCATTTTSNTARTATEQLLISNAIDQSLDKVDFSAFAGQRVFLDDKYVDGVDKNYLLGSIRHRIVYHGGFVAPAADQADILLEARSGGIGTDQAETFYGLPEVVIPGMITIPELKFITRTSQRGMAKIAFVALDAKTRNILGQGGTSLAMADANNWSVLGIGPFKSGSVKEEVSASVVSDQYNPNAGLPRSVVFGQPPVPSDPYRLTGHGSDR